MPAYPVRPAAMADQNCCDVDIESLADLFETTVEVPVGLFLAGRCC